MQRQMALLAKRLEQRWAQMSDEDRVPYQQRADEPQHGQSQQA